VRAERAAGRGTLSRWLAAVAERRLAALTLATRLVLGTARLLRIGRLPGTRIRLSAPASRLPSRWPLAEAGAPTVVYLPSCLGRPFGDDDLPPLFARLCAAAGIGVVLPAGAAGLCCGQPFASKGFPAQAERAARRSQAAVLAAGGAQPFMAVTDTSSCAAQLAGVTASSAGDAIAWTRVTNLDPASFAATILIPRLHARGRLRPAATDLLLHPTCSEHQHGWTQALRDAVQATTCGVVHLPAAAGCCGMAGDKGWSLPALTAHATKREAEQARASGAGCGVTTSATCGAALGAASGLPYRHLFALLAEALS
jgi:D-lactate dehydrogenase